MDSQLVTFKAYEIGAKEVLSITECDGYIDVLAKVTDKDNLIYRFFEDGKILFLEET